MIDRCKNYLNESTCLLRQLAEGAATGDAATCQHCDVTLAELERNESLVKQVAGELSASIEHEAGYGRAAQLARGAWNAQKDNADEETGDIGSSRFGIRCPSCGSLSNIAVESTLNNHACSTCGEPIRIVDDKHDGDKGIGDKLLGHFRLIEQVGAGSFGVVWRAEDTQLDRTVAIKIPRRHQLSSREIDNFVNEARASAALNHPGIVGVHEIGRDTDSSGTDSVYIVSDFVEGETLDNYLAGKLLTAKEAATMCVTICDAIHHAHEKGVVHRDLKPGNIAIDRSLNPVIMDFGLALHGSTEMTMTADGKILGTPAYMSPEQARGESHTADRRSDIYSLGVILYQMLTRERPFRGNLRMLLNQIMYDEPLNPQKLNSAVPRDLATICLKCLEKSPDRRYQTANELKSEFERFLEGRPIAARPVSSIERGWRWCRRNPLPAALTTMLLVSLVAGTTVSTWKSIEAQSSAAAALASTEEANVSAKRSADVLTVVTDAFESINPRSGADSTMSAKDVLIEAARSLAESDLDDEGRMELLSKLSQCLSAIGEYEAAMELEQQLVDLRTQALGEDHPKTLKALNNLSQSYASRGKFQKAIELQKKVLAKRTAILGDEHLDTLTSMNNLANHYMQVGRLDDALPLHEDSLRAYRKIKGDSHSTTIGSINNLATVYQQLGRFDDAVPLFQQAIDLFCDKYGDDHPDTLTAVNNLGHAYLMADQAAKSIPYFEKVVRLIRVKLGDEHINTILSMNNLGLAYAKAGQPAEAEAILEETVKLSRSRLGDDHSVVYSLMSQLAYAYELNDRIDDALSVLEESYPARKAKSPESWWTFETQSQYGGLLLKLGRTDESSTHLIESFQKMQRRAGEIRPSEVRDRTARALKRLIALAEAQENPEDASAWQLKLDELLETKP